MTVSVNSIEISVEPGASEHLTAARELLRQRAVAVGLLGADAGEKAAVDEALEALLAPEVVTPSPTGDDCRRY